MDSTYKNSLPHADPLWVEHGYGTRFQGFQNLMRLRIRDILLVSSLYDLYVFEEDGRLYELIRDKYQGLNLSHAPELTRVSSGVEAIRLAREERRFDMIITTLHIEDMNVVKFAQNLKKEGVDIPVVLLAFDNRELSELMLHQDPHVFDQIFIWQGDFKLLIAIIKHLEDKLNVEHDTKIVGVQSIIIIEDNVRYYSSFLPMIYLEVMKQAERLISEGINLSHKQLRQRARPKIILCKTYEEAWAFFKEYQDTVLGIISDVDFPRNNKADPNAGFEFVTNVKKLHTDIPILLHSNQPDNEEKAKALNCSFILKDSPILLDKVREFMINHLSFGDFVFKTPDGAKVACADDLLSLEEQLHTVPDSCVEYHAARNHFSNWLKARTEFWLAHQLRPRKVTDFPTIGDLRHDLIKSLHDYRSLRQRGVVTDFSKHTFDPESSIARIGGGSLGGKARGLSFVNILINNYKVQEQFDGVRIYIPAALILGTDIFDKFLQENDLRHFALKTENDDLILHKFIKAQKFPQNITAALKIFLRLVNSPLAVRSSSLLEDSHNQPFAGVYKTYMLPNSNPDPGGRLQELIITIKKVYASTYLRPARDYIKATSYRLEEEKMAVIIQKMIGSDHSDKFYPHFSGVARSHNFYPISPQKSSDGIISAAVGLGKMVVEGGSTVRFSPKYPKHIVQFSTPALSLKNNQTEFYALDLKREFKNSDNSSDQFVNKYPLKVAEDDGVLSNLASTYSAENDHIYDGIGREGTRIVTFAPILKNKVFPLSEISELLLDMGSWGMGTPVEIEFAVDLTSLPDKPKEFGILQMRPMVLNRELEVLDIDNFRDEDLICHSQQVMGNGVLKNMYDIVLVDRDKFDRSQSRNVAAEVGVLNSRLLKEKRPYLLIGVGRWGTLDPWLGIPVTWDQISGARAIIESGFKDFDVMPSQGSHFFQNLNSFMVGYYTITTKDKNSFINWEWLTQQEPVEVFEYTRLLRFDDPIVVKMDGHKNRGIILKPESSIV